MNEPSATQINDDMTTRPFVSQDAGRSRDKATLKGTVIDTNTHPFSGQFARADGTSVKPLTLPDDTIVIRPGDTLRSLAGRAYGDEDAYPFIVAANPGIEWKTLRVGDELNV